MHFPGQEHLPANKTEAPKPGPPASTPANTKVQQVQEANTINRRATAVNMAKEFLINRGVPPKTDELLELAADIDDFLLGKITVEAGGSSAVKK